MDPSIEQVTLGELVRAVRRVEQAAERIERAVNHHDVRLSLLEQTRADVRWTVHLAWMAVVAVVEGLFHWKSQ